MRIAAQSSSDFSTQNTAAKAIPTTTSSESATTNTNVSATENSPEITNQPVLEGEALKEKLEPAIDAVNELLESTNKASKFVLHEGLNKYFVRLVDAKTDEVIKEIPPQRLLDAFYELQKLAGMIVDEKI